MNNLIQSNLLTLKDIHTRTELWKDKIYNCPFCNKEFSCELGNDMLWREEKDELNEKNETH